MTSILLLNIENIKAYSNLAAADWDSEHKGGINMGRLLPFLFFGSIAMVTTSAWADGECAKIKNTKDRLTCIEQKIDSLNKVKVMSVTRTQCMAWVDTGKPVVSAGCDGSDNVWQLVPSK